MSEEEKKKGFFGKLFGGDSEEPVEGDEGAEKSVYIPPEEDLPRYEDDYVPTYGTGGLEPPFSYSRLLEPQEVVP